MNVALTPTQIECMEKHKAFRAKIARQAKPDTGISCPSASAKVPLITLIEPDITAWAEPQQEIPLPPPKEPWFHIIEEIGDTGISIPEIQRAVAKDYNIQLEYMLSHRHQAVIVRPRQVAMYLSDEMTTATLPMIGRKFGRDHTTIMHGVRKIRRLCTEDAVLCARIEALKTLITERHNERHLHNPAPAAASSQTSQNKISPVAHGPGAAALHSPR